MKKTFFQMTLMLLVVVLSGAKLSAQEVPHVYINPGHGGHESDDRNVVVAPFAAGDTAGFWESNASLKKGFSLNNNLRKKGYTTSMSRITNDANSDLALSTIVALSNASGADIFYAIHSNATGAGEGYRINFPLGLYRGYTGQPEIANSDVLASKLGNYLLMNQSTVWTKNNYDLYGDWTFYPSWGYQVGLGVLRGNKVVSMLSEGSFHDYIPETYRLINGDYCWVEGFNFSLGADDYFDRLDRFEQGIITGNIRDNRLLRNATFVMHGADQRQPVNGATVKLYDSEGNLVETTTTDNIENGIYLFKYVEPGTYTIEVSEPEHFGETKEVTVSANAVTYCNFDLKRVRNTPPEVISYTPQWSEGDQALACNTPIVLQFNWDMDVASTEEAFSITPAVDGKFTWEDTNYRLVFNPTDAYDIDTDYTLTLKKTAQHAGGTEMVEDFVLKFRTQSRNHINELAMFPSEGDEVHYKAGALVEFRSDSLLNSKDLFTLFHVYDKDNNELEFSKRSIKNNKKGDDYGYIRLPLLKELVPGDEYRVLVDMSVSDTVGLHLPAALDYKFKAVDASKQGLENEVVEEFESIDNFSIAPTDNGATGKLTANSDHLFGSKSMQVAYDFMFDSETALEINAAEPLNAEFHNGDPIGLYIMGDMSYNTLTARFTGALGDVKEVPVSKLTYHGWRYCEVQAQGLEPNESYRLTGFNLVKNNTKMGRSGSIRLDNLMRAKPSGIREVNVKGVKIVANVVSDYIVADADGIVVGMELYDVNGRMVKRNTGNYINVTDVADGIYVVSVYSGVGKAVKKVVVKH